MKSHIIIFVDSGLYGGIESHIIQLAKLLLHHQIDLEVLFYKDHKNIFFYEQLKHNKINYHILNGQPFSLYHYLNKQTQPYVLHTHGYKAGIIGRIICKFISKPCISTYHAGETGSGKLRFYNLFDRLTSVLSRNFAVSEQIAANISRATILNNFVSIKQFNYTPPSNTIRVAFVGRLSFEKGPDIFIQVAKKFINNKAFSFHIYGDGPMKNTLQDNFPENLTFHGHQKADVIWPNIDLLMITSRQEGLPLALLEAINHCTCVISTQVGAVNKVIKNNYSGMICENITSDSLGSTLNTWQQLNTQQKLLLIKNAHNTLIKSFSGTQQLKLLTCAYKLRYGRG
ncbi:glycosyltransferase family 4 protein [Pseudoalteromonas denitrificans]|uniref:Glycosyltransferase involved in cell wall bisynthesis n=1 Tax=Pseudoalteromonas denitrificans DSM 6059 TaxID=1123010 RepID=A0A1I1EQG4_9GAMM|nr:glycosyltransferase family 4 protein [Pseudoalteromonas denitrificans]SFB89321.1 Glycosyltransferase involved in cell wall bisynthesis [Pseudoalteromonas denitrificans DSM 6059]